MLDFGYKSFTLRMKSDTPSNCQHRGTTDNKNPIKEKAVRIGCSIGQEATMVSAMREKAGDYVLRGLKE